MILDIDVSLTCTVEQPFDMILQVRAPNLAVQRLLSETYGIEKAPQNIDVDAEAGPGESILLRTSQGLDCTYKLQLEIDRPALEIASPDRVPPHL